MEVEVQVMGDDRKVYSLKLSELPGKIDSKGYYITTRGIDEDGRYLIPPPLHTQFWGIVDYYGDPVTAYTWNNTNNFCARMLAAGNVFASKEAAQKEVTRRLKAQAARLEAWQERDNPWRYAPKAAEFGGKNPLPPDITSIDLMFFNGTKSYAQIPSAFTWGDGGIVAWRKHVPNAAG